MFTPPVRLFLFFSCLAYGGWKLTVGDRSGWFILLAAVLIVWGHFRYGAVWLAFRAIKRGDVARARVLVAQISHPERLSRQNRGYYHWLQGGFALEDGDYDGARKHLETAKELGVRTSTNMTVLACQLAETCFRLGETAEARKWLEEVRSQSHKSSIDSIIAKVERLIEGEV